MLLIQINWGKIGKLFYIPLQVQDHVFEHMGRERYLKPPKAGTNPRGVEISKEALLALTQNEKTKHIDVYWKRSI